jgi:hypothetical protein
MRAKISFWQYKGRWSSNFETSTWASRSGHAARDGPRGCRCLGDPLAAPAGLLRPHGLDHLQACRDQLEHLGDVLADEPQGSAAVRAGLARVEHDALARRGGADLGLAPPRRGFTRRTGFLHRFCLVLIIGDRLPGGRGGDLDRLQSQLELLDLALDPFRARAELLPLEPGDADPERLNQRLVRPDRGHHPLDIRPHPGVLRLERGDLRLQLGGVVGQRSQGV